MKLRSPASPRRSPAHWARVAAVTALVAILALAITTFVITGTRPSSRADEQTRVGDMATFERVADAAAPARVAESDLATPHSVRGTVYRHSVVPGGVRNAGDAIQAAARDDVVARHYADVDLASMRAEVLEKDRVAYVSFRKGDQIFWTTRKVVIPAGETILSNGTTAIRARCGNLLSAVPLQPTSETDITELDLIDVPDSVAITTNAPVNGRPLPLDDLFALARLLPDTDLTLLAPPGDTTHLGPSPLFGGGLGLVGGFYGGSANTPLSQDELPLVESLGPFVPSDTLLPPPDALSPSPDGPLLPPDPERVPDVVPTTVPAGPPSDKTPPGPPVSVPEPATWVLLGTGVALTFLKRRRSFRRD